MSAEIDLDRRDLASNAESRQPRAAGARKDRDVSDEEAAPPRAESEARRETRRRRPAWRSPLTRRILAINVLVIAIPVLGLLHLDQYRQSLIASELEAMRIQARAFALSLGSTAAVGGQIGDERLLPDITRSLMRLLLADIGVRVRVFVPGGELIADSFRLVGPGGQVQVMELPPPDDDSTLGTLGKLYDWVTNWLPGMGNLPRYQEEAEQRAEHYEEVPRAMLGESSGMVRLDNQKRLVLSVAVPVQRYRQILGALMLSKDGGSVTKAVRDRRRDILLVFGVALAITVLLSLYLARTLARPIQRLALAADQVRHSKGRRVEIPDLSGRDDEIGELASALHEMTEALWNRLDAIESFAADVAHEIKNPLTSLRSAVETVARLEDPEQQKKLVSIILDDVQRLDRLITDISDASRLDAELSRAEIETVDVGRLLQTLVEVQRAAAKDGGPHFELQVARNQRLVVQGLEGRLGQVVRNLISNAVSFSPPGGTISLAARREQRSVEIAVSDEGPGLPPANLDSVFDRFYSERPEGEKFGTHSGLGLSISRQIVEAHGGTIRAENRVDERGKIRGARFVITLPAG